MVTIMKEFCNDFIIIYVYIYIYIYIYQTAILYVTYNPAVSDLRTIFITSPCLNPKNLAIGSLNNIRGNYVSFILYFCSKI